MKVAKIIVKSIFRQFLKVVVVILILKFCLAVFFFIFHHIKIYVLLIFLSLLWKIILSLLFYCKYEFMEYYIIFSQIFHILASKLLIKNFQSRK